MFFDIRKREAQSFNDDFFICPPPPITCDTHRKASASSESQPSSSNARTPLNSLSSNLSSRFRCMTSFTSPGHIFYQGFPLWHLWMTHPLRARVNTCAHVCTWLTHALSWKFLSLTKPKGKIYKTKSLSHYITLIKLMTRFDWQGSSLSLCPTFPFLNPHYNMTFESLTLSEVLSGGRQRQITSLHLLHNKYFWLLLQFYGPIQTCILHIHLCSFQITEWSYTQWDSASTTTMLPITVGTFNGLNCFAHVIYVP